MSKIITGIKPTGTSLTLGNYIGGLLPTIKYQNDNELFVFIADLHAITLPIAPQDLKENTENLIATYLAAGLDPNKVCLFKQSEISAHNQLEWILTCNVLVSDLFMMTQYKAKSQTLEARHGIPASLLNYPILMASDILLYDSDFVTCGQDQKQHIELTHTIAERFNKIYGETFKLPEPLLAKQGAKIMSLSDPTKKMSKSESDKGTIYLSDNEETIRNKIRKATTDSECRIYYDPVNKPGVSNLLTIMSCLSGRPVDDIVNEFKNETNYGVFKNKVADVVWAELSPLQDKCNYYKSNDYINEVLNSGKIKAEKIANTKIEEVYKKVGLR